MGRKFAGIDVARRASEVVLGIMNERKWSKTEMARQLGTTRYVIYLWLEGLTSPDVPSLQKIHALGGDVLYIVTGERR